MATIDELRRKWAVGLTQPEPGEKVLPAQTTVPSEFRDNDVGIVWSEAEVRSWSMRGDVITAGRTLGPNPKQTGIVVKDFRFKNGRFRGKTITEAAATHGRTYLRWWYCQITPSDVTAGMFELVRTVLGESDEVIRARHAEDDKDLNNDAS